MEVKTRYIIPRRGKFKGSLLECTSITIPINLRPKAAKIVAKKKVTK